MGYVTHDDDAERAAQEEAAALAVLIAFDDHLDQLAEANGVELDESARQAIFEQTVDSGNGLNPDSTLAVFSSYTGVEPPPPADEGIGGYTFEQVEASLDLQMGRAETKLGRDLNNSEREHVVKQAALQVRAGDEIDVQDALDDYAARFATPAAAERHYEQVVDELGRTEFFEQLDNGEIDLSKREGKDAYDAARVRGWITDDDEIEGEPADSDDVDDADLPPALRKQINPGSMTRESSDATEWMVARVQELNAQAEGEANAA